MLAAAAIVIWLAWGGECVDPRLVPHNGPSMSDPISANDAFGPGWSWMACYRDTIIGMMMFTAPFVVFLDVVSFRARSEDLLMNDQVRARLFERGYWT